MDSSSDGDRSTQPGQDVPAVMPSWDQRAWPEWARTGKPQAGELEPRPAMAGWVGFSRTSFAWNIWRERSRSKPPAENHRAGVVATAACTSIVVSLLTMWLSAPEGAVRSDSGGTVTVSYEPLEASVLPPPVDVVADDADPVEPVVLSRAGTRSTAPIAPPTPPRPVAAPPPPDPRPDPAPAPAPRPQRTQQTPLPTPAPPRVTRVASAAPRQPALVVITAPEGARVTINGMAYGTSPLTVPYLPPGAKRIRVTKDGYTSEERVVWADMGRGGTLRIELREAEPGALR